MPHLTRRHLLASTVLIVPVAGCAALGLSTTLTPATIVSQALALAQGLSGMLTQVAAAYPALVPAATLAMLTKDLTLATGAANTLTTALPAASGASIAQTIDGYINAVLTTLAGPPINGLIPSPFNMAVAAAAIVVPQIEAFVNQYLPASMTTAGAAPGALAARAKFAAVAPALTTQGALVILQGYAQP
jgi:hypothetical protein